MDSKRNVNKIYLMACVDYVSLIVNTIGSTNVASLWLIVNGLGNSKQFKNNSQKEWAWSWLHHIHLRRKGMHVLSGLSLLVSTCYWPNSYLQFYVKLANVWWNINDNLIEIWTFFDNLWLWELQLCWFLT